jgi:hypothetical protein
VRGKLRDKRPDSRQDRIKSEQMERRRPPKRESRITLLQIQHLEDDYLFDDEEVQLVTTKNNQQ